MGSRDACQGHGTCKTHSGCKRRLDCPADYKDQDPFWDVCYCDPLWAANSHDDCSFNLLLFYLVIGGVIAACIIRPMVCICSNARLYMVHRLNPGPEEGMLDRERRVAQEQSRRMTQRQRQLSAGRSSCLVSMDHPAYSFNMNLLTVAEEGSVNSEGDSFTKSQGTRTSLLTT